MKKIVIYPSLLALPTVVSAQNEIVDSDLGDFIRDIQGFINELLIPLVFVIALLVFLYGIFKYFIQGSDSEADRESGKKYILWAIIGFVVMVSVWGIVALLAGVIPEGTVTPPTI